MVTMSKCKTQKQELNTRNKSYYKKRSCCNIRNKNKTKETKVNVGNGVNVRNKNKYKSKCQKIIIIPFSSGPWSANVLTGTWVTTLRVAKPFPRSSPAARETTIVRTR